MAWRPSFTTMVTYSVPESGILKTVHTWMGYESLCFFPCREIVKALNHDLMRINVDIFSCIEGCARPWIGGRLALLFTFVNDRLFSK